jgi:hypothetical protein
VATTRQINRGDGVAVKILFKKKKNIQRGNHTTTPNEKEEVAALQGRSTEERRCIFFFFLPFWFCLFYVLKTLFKIFFLFRNGTKFTKQMYFVASINKSFQIRPLTKNASQFLHFQKLFLKHKTQNIFKNFVKQTNDLLAQ